ncbi:MAG: DUF2237 domain-containing protein [Deltaproteobacteria bacterium]|nr:DUF2237 domain-containing protein [Deltaproteobacteria bacterium]
MLACATGRGPQQNPSAGSSARAESAPSGASTSCAIPPRPSEPEQNAPRNVNGSALMTCGTSPMTGAYRDGRCTTGPEDLGVHVVCARVTEEFLEFTRERGNDLVSPRGGFPGLRPGDRWCLCGARWAEAETGGVAPPVDLAATHEQALRFATLDTLAKHALP